MYTFSYYIFSIAGLLLHSFFHCCFSLARCCCCLRLNMTIRKKCNATEKFYPFHRALFSALCTSNFFLLTSFCAFFPTFFLQFNIQSADAVFIIMKKTKYKCKNLLTISKKYMYTIYMKYEAAAAIFWRKSEVREELREEKKKLLKASFYFTSMPLPVCCCCCCCFFRSSTPSTGCVFYTSSFQFQFIFHAFKKRFFSPFSREPEKNRIWNFCIFSSSSSLQWMKIHRISRDEWMKKIVSNISFPLWWDLWMISRRRRKSLRFTLSMQTTMLLLLHAVYQSSLSCQGSLIDATKSATPHTALLQLRKLTKLWAI